MGLPTPTIGAIGELIISVDLMKRGYPVFRALSPSCPCDLAIVIGRRVVRIEVTRANRLSNGRLSFNKHDSAKYDVLALWWGNEIEYRPPLSQFVDEP